MNFPWISVIKYTFTVTYLPSVIRIVAGYDNLTLTETLRSLELNMAFLGILLYIYCNQKL